MKNILLQLKSIIELSEVVDISYNCHDFYFKGSYICRTSDNSPSYEMKQFECKVDVFDHIILFTITAESFGMSMERIVKKNE